MLESLNALIDGNEHRSDDLCKRVSKALWYSEEYAEEANFLMQFVDITPNITDDNKTINTKILNGISTHYPVGNKRDDRSMHLIFDLLLHCMRWDKNGK